MVDEECCVAYAWLYLIFPAVLFSVRDTGMKADSPNKDISAKDIVSSIISAANRKMQKAKARKGGRGTGSGASVDDGRETSGEVKEIADTKQVTLRWLLKS